MKDDHVGRQYGYSAVYHFLNPPNTEYLASAAVLKNPPIREIRCDSEFCRGAGDPDYLMDPKMDPANGQEFYFQTKNAKSVVLPFWPRR